MDNLKLGYTIFEKQARELNKQYPGLIFFKNGDRPGLKGVIELVDKDKTIHDSYFIEILATEFFPYRFPLLFETGGMIPKNIDWHVFENDGHCCIKATPEEILICKDGISLNKFIKQEVEPYLFNQTYRRLNGFFLHDRAHGIKGWIQYFEEIFKSTDLNFIKWALRFISQQKEPNRVALCFCGSGLKYRRCHRDAYKILSRYSESDFKFLFNALGILA